MNIIPFNPPQIKLMGPGPSDVYPRVLSALSRPTLGHLDPLFIKMMDEIKYLMQSAFQTKNTFTLPISAPGSAGMEFCIVNLLERGDKAIVCRNGVFGMRLTENIQRAGATTILVDDDWGSPVNLEKVEKALTENPDAKLLTFVHAETSTGAKSDAKNLVALAKEKGILTVVDCVTSLGGIPLEIDNWGIDAAYSGSQKCLSVPPGLSPVTMSSDAIERISQRKQKVQSWFLDANLLTGYWEKSDSSPTRSYHHTAPINSLYGIHEGLLILQEEGLSASFERHQKMHLALVAGIEAMGLKMLVAENDRLPQLNSIVVPDSVDEARVRKMLLDEHQLEIGAGLGPLAGKIWRIGLMGYGARKENVLYCLNALENVLTKLNTPIEMNQAVAAAEKLL